MKRKKNKKVYDALTAKHSDYLIQAGWFEQSKYSNGAPIGGIAAVQNYGAVIHQTVTEKQRAYLHYQGIHLKESTKDLHIVIPPTHFYENCINKNKQKWRKLVHDAWKKILLGDIDEQTAIEFIALSLEGDLVKSITQGDFPPDKPSTIQAKLKKYKDQKTVGSLDERLRATGQMVNAISHKVKKK